MTDWLTGWLAGWVMRIVPRLSSCKEIKTKNNFERKEFNFQKKERQIYLLFSVITSLAQLAWCFIQLYVTSNIHSSRKLCLSFPQHKSKRNWRVNRTQWQTLKALKLIALLLNKVIYSSLVKGKFMKGLKTRVNLPEYLNFFNISQ